jgi:hypothetical protein
VDRIKSICIEEELCQSHDGSLEQILKQMLSYKNYMPYNAVVKIGEKDILILYLSQNKYKSPLKGLLYINLNHLSQITSD